MLPVELCHIKHPTLLKEYRAEIAVYPPLITAYVALCRYALCVFREDVMIK